jgi:hypothetical protein
MKVLRILGIGSLLLVVSENATAIASLLSKLRYDQLSHSSLLVQSVSAQFGIGRKKTVSSSFEELNEQMKQREAAATGGANSAAGTEQQQLQKLMAELGSLADNPEMKKAMDSMGESMQEALKQLQNLSPEQIQEQMAQVAEMIQKGDLVDSIIEQKDEVLKNLEQSGLVPPEELAKFKKDPDYFESQMRGAFQQMQGIFSDPNLLQASANAMKNFEQALEDPLVQDLQKLLMQPNDPTDDEIEEMRLRMLQSQNDEETNTVLSSMFGLDDFQTSLRDVALWKESLMEGRKAIQEMAALAGARGGASAGRVAAGAGVGEL